MKLSHIRILYKLVCAVGYFAITSLIPKKKNLWVFGSWKGKNFSDNAKELFLFVNRCHKEVEAVWVAKNKRIYNEVAGMGYKVVLYSTIKGKWLVARAGANIQTESNEDTGSYRVCGTKIIQLFHGYGSVKEAYLYPNMGLIKKHLVKIYAENHTKSYWMVPSSYFVDRLPILFDIDKQKTRITGQPRIDLLFANKTISYFERYKSGYSDYKFIFYAPTHRNYAQSSAVDFSEMDWQKFNDFCQKNHYICFFKPHPLELHKYLDTFGSYSNLILLSNDIEDCPNDVYEYMHYFDMIISDYSSIATDFLVFDRPVVHFMYDIDDFENENFTLSAIEKFKAGPICRTWNELFDAIKSGFEVDQFKGLREKARSCAFKYVDNKNCERVYNNIIDILYARKAN